MVVHIPKHGHAGNVECGVGLLAFEDSGTLAGVVAALDRIPLPWRPRRRLSLVAAVDALACVVGLLDISAFVVDVYNVAVDACARYVADRASTAEVLPQGDFAVGYFDERVGTVVSLYLVVGSVYPYRACEAGRLQGVAGLPYLLVGPGGALCLGKREVAYQTVFPVVDNLYLDGVLAGFDIGSDVQAVRTRPHPAGVLAVNLHFGSDHNLAERQVARQTLGVVYLEFVAVYGGA